MTFDRSQRRPVDVDEWLARLRQSPEYIAREQERERTQQEAIREYYQAAAPLLAELAESGFAVESVGVLYHRGINYKDAIPILLKWLPRIEYRYLKEDIVVALTVKWARPIAAPILIEEFRRASYPTPGYKWTVGNALSVVADDSVYDEIVELARDKQHGKAREMVVASLANMKNPQAVDVLIGLLDDEEVPGYALLALRKLGKKAEKARPHIERFLAHPDTWVRNQAKGALAKMDKAK